MASVTRRKFLRQTAALVATGILPIASVRATWDKLPPEPEEAPVSDAGFIVWGERTYKPKTFGEFEQALMKTLTEEIAKDIDRMFIGLMQEAAKPGMARQVFPVEGSV